MQLMYLFLAVWKSSFKILNSETKEHMNQLAVLYSNSNQLEAMNQTAVLIFSSFFQQTQEKLISPLSISTFLIIILTTTILHSLHKNRNRHGLPYSYPLLGMHPCVFYALSTNIHEWFTKILNKNNGTFIYKGPGFNNYVITSNPQNMEYLLKTHFSNFVKGNLFQENFRDLLGDGIFTADGDSWLRQRKASSIVIHSAEFKKLTTDLLLELVQSRLIPILDQEIIKEEDDPGSSFDLQEMLLRLTFDNVCMISFGVDPGCLSLGLPDVSFVRAYEGVAAVSYLRLYLPVFVREVMKFLRLGWERKLKRLIQQVDEFAEEVICKRMKEVNLGSDQKSRSDILTSFMGLKDDEGKPFSNKFLRDICVNFILAGRDSSSVALTWFFWLLDQNPVVEERILEELCQIVAERKEFRGEKIREVRDRIDVVFRADEVKKMDYLLAAISESLRLYPSVPLNSKEAIEDDVLPDGTVLNKGAKILYSIYTMGRMESLWGKDCWEFKPERWLKDEQFMSESPYKFTAFNAGPRLCLGKDFAYYQMKFVAASIIYRYRVKVVENHPVESKLAMTMFMKYGLKVTLKRRDHVH